MPAPTVKCSVCDETVLKSRTRHVGGGSRACKTHEGVVDTAKEVHAKQLAEIQRKNDAEKNKNEHKRKLRDCDPVFLDLHCQICNRPAVKMQDVIIELLVISRQMEMEDGHPGALFDAMFKEDDTIIKRLQERFPGRVGIYGYAKEELGDRWNEVLRRSQQRWREAIRMVEVVGICVDCARELNLPNKVTNLPQPPIETTMMLGLGVDEALTEIVEKRREQNND